MSLPDGAGLPVPLARRAVWLCVRRQGFGNRTYNAGPTNRAFSQDRYMVRFTAAENNSSSEVQNFGSRSIFLKSFAITVRQYRMREITSAVMRILMMPSGRQWRAWERPISSPIHRRMSSETCESQDRVLSKVTPRFPTCALGCNTASRNDTLKLGNSRRLRKATTLTQSTGRHPWH